MTDALLFEACVESLAEAVAAEKQGAGRIELCADLEHEGLTPALELTRACAAALTIPVMVMVRPRAGDFCYSPAEISHMEGEIRSCKEAGVAGVVIGLLTPEGRVDLENTGRLVRAAAPLEVTFHKAIDCCADLAGAFTALQAISGITRVLTSGGKATAWEGREVLRRMQAWPGRRTRLIAAGRITPANRAAIAAYTGITELHGREIIRPAKDV